MSVKTLTKDDLKTIKKLKKIFKTDFLFGKEVSPEILEHIKSLEYYIKKVKDNELP